MPAGTLAAQTYLLQRRLAALALKLPHPPSPTWLPACAGEQLRLSSLGVGTYLGEANDWTDEAVSAAVVTSVMSGWNVIDTGEGGMNTYH
jgi:hypothetical protein